MEVNRILIPIDFSPCSIDALKYAIAMNKEMKAEVYVMYSYSIPVYATDVPMSAPIPFDEQLHRTELQERFDKIVGQHSELKAQNLDLNIKIGFPVEAIKEEAEEKNIDLIVMGTKGTHNPIDEWMGSTSYDVIRSSPSCVMVIPEGAVFQPFDKMVFATDYRHIKYQEGLEVFTSFARRYNSEVHILNVSENPEKMDAKATDEAYMLDQYFRDMPHYFDFVRNKDVLEGISEYIDGNDISLLTMMPKKHTVLDRLFGNSVTKKVVSHLKTPLLSFNR